MDLEIQNVPETNARVDLNEATEDLITHDLGLDEDLSRAIVAYRRRLGRFSALAELLNVPGFSGKLLQSLRSRILI